MRKFRKILRREIRRNIKSFIPVPPVIITQNHKKKTFKIIFIRKDNCHLKFSVNRKSKIIAHIAMNYNAPAGERLSESRKKNPLCFDDDT